MMTLCLHSASVGLKLAQPSVANDRLVRDKGEDEMIGDEDEDEMMGNKEEDEVMGDEDEEEDEDESEIIAPDDDGKYRLHENDFIIYNCSYYGPFDAIWMAIFELNFAWEIRKVYPEKGQNVEEIWPDEPGLEPTVLKVKLSIPPKCTDNDPDDTAFAGVVFRQLFAWIESSKPYSCHPRISDLHVWPSISVLHSWFSL
jgi:hypothetical protein